MRKQTSAGETPSGPATLAQMVESWREENAAVLGVDIAATEVRHKIVWVALRLDFNDTCICVVLAQKPDIFVIGSRKVNLKLKDGAIMVRTIGGLKHIVDFIVETRNATPKGR